MTNSKIFLFCLIAFLFGIFFGSFFSIPKIIVYEIIVLGIIYSFFKKRAVLCFGLLMLVFGFGVLRVPHVYSDIRYSSVESNNFFKEKFSNVIKEKLPFPESSILGAILLGKKNDISKEWKEKLNKAGVRHVTAVSGMHIVILSSILLWLGMAFGFHRGQSFYFSLCFIWLFIFMIGFQPSAVRAGIMGSLFLFCEKTGRQKSSSRALLMTGGLMLLFDPLLLRYSIGFQLSFLASLGIIHLAPFFKRLLRKVRFKEILSITFAAQVFTLPILLYNFGQMSIISPITNILIVPILPYIMVLGFLFVILGAIFLPLSYIFLFPLFVLLKYLTKVVEVFAFPVLSYSFHWIWIFIFYIVLSFFVWGLNKKNDKIFI